MEGAKMALTHMSLYHKFIIILESSLELLYFKAQIMSLLRVSAVCIKAPVINYWLFQSGAVGLF